MRTILVMSFSLTDTALRPGYLSLVSKFAALTLESRLPRVRAVQLVNMASSDYDILHIPSETFSEGQADEEGILPYRDSSFTGKSSPRVKSTVRLRVRIAPLQ